MELRSRDSSHRHGVHAKRQERDEHPTVRERERRCPQTADNLTSSPSSERAKRAQPVATGRKCERPKNGSNKPIGNGWQPTATVSERRFYVVKASGGSARSCR